MSKKYCKASVRLLRKTPMSPTEDLYIPKNKIKNSSLCISTALTTKNGPQERESKIVRVSPRTLILVKRLTPSPFLICLLKLFMIDPQYKDN